MNLLEKKHVRLDFEPDVPCVTMTSLAFMTSEEFREPFNIGLEFMAKNMKQYPNMSWLNDSRKQKTAKLDDVKWINQYVNTKAYEMGVKKVAFVLPENIFGKMVIKTYVSLTMSRSDNKLNIKAFKELEDAKQWLKSAVDVPVNEVEV